MFAQVVEYLETKPVPQAACFRLAAEARAAVTICMRLGSYFAVLTNPSLPFSPSVDDASASHIHDDEMARMNIEISAAIAWWFNLKGSDDKRYTGLVNRAITYPPLGRKTVAQSSQSSSLKSCASAYFAAELRHAWPAALLEQDLRLAATHPIRLIANAVTLRAWRNGPIENIHAGRRAAYAMHERRMVARDEKAIVRQAQDAIYGVLQAVEYMVFDGAWPPPAERVLPFMRPLLHPRDCSCAEQSRVIQLPRRAAVAGKCE
jgi:hypothetical protein